MASGCLRGGQPQNIIGEIEEFFRAAAPLTLFAEIVDEQYFLYLGNVNVRDTAYVNLTAVFDIGKSLWWLREFADTMTIFAERNVAGKRRLYMGTSGGKVMDKGKYTDDTLVSDDDGSNISSTFILPPIHVEALQNVKKILNLTAFAERAGGLKLKARIIDRNNRIATDFEEIGELTKYVETFELDVSDGVLLQIMGVENGNKPYWIFLGHDLGVEPYGRIIK